MSYLQFSSPEIPESLRLPVLTGQSGIPRYWVTVWSTLSLHDLAPSTAAKKLRYLEALYVYADSVYGPDSLDEAIGRVDMDILGNLLEGYFVSLRNRVVVNGETEFQWQTGLKFVMDALKRIGKSGAMQGKLAKMQTRLLRMDRYATPRLPFAAIFWESSETCCANHCYGEQQISRNRFRNRLSMKYSSSPSWASFYGVQHLP